MFLTLIKEGRTTEKLQRQRLADALQNMLLEVRRSLWVKGKVSKWCFIIFSLSRLIAVSVKFRQSLTLGQRQNYRFQVWMQWKEKVSKSILEVCIIESQLVKNTTWMYFLVFFRKGKSFLEAWHTPEVP